MTQRVGEKSFVGNDPSGSIFLFENLETEDDFSRLRQQVIFGRGAFQGARLDIDEAEWLLEELRQRSVARFGAQVMEGVVGKSL